jgi:hypothetical protein
MASDDNVVTCGSCGRLGDLISCGGCQASFHYRCAGYGEMAHVIRSGSGCMYGMCNTDTALVDLQMAPQTCLMAGGYAGSAHKSVVVLFNTQPCWSVTTNIT